MIDIYLQYPWKFPDSPYYKYLVNYPPKGVNYINVKKQRFGVVTSKKKFALLNFTKKSVRFVLNKFKLPIPNAHISPTQDYDLIHCAHCLSLNKKPWVADFEAAWQMWISGMDTRLGKQVVRKILLSKYCKKIMPWTNATKQQILQIFPEKKIKEKIEVVYPAVPLPKIKKKKKKNEITILYVSRYFWIKGGLIALETLRRLKKKYDINEYFISDVPPHIKKKYKEINIIGLVPQEKLFNYYYPNSDIFFYPSFSDNFGFALLEAMSFGLPIVTITTPHTPGRNEIVTAQVGFIRSLSKVPNIYSLTKLKGLINFLFTSISFLLISSKLRKKMSRNCRKIIKEGKFSIKYRNKKIKEIYEIVKR